jgi:phage-related protein
MSKLTYISGRSEAAKPLVWLRRGIKTPPLSRNARVELGYRLRLLQEGVVLRMPHCRPMRAAGKSCYELRVRDAGFNWRLVFRVDDDAIVIAGLFRKTSRSSTDRLIEVSRRRFSRYDAAAKG